MGNLFTWLVDLLSASLFLIVLTGIAIVTALVCVAYRLLNEWLNNRA